MPTNRTASGREPIAAALWPRGGGRRDIVLIALGVLLLTASAKISLPLPPVPMTLQTLVVLLIGALYGWRLGILTMVVYLGAGACGLPVFAGPVAGMKALAGPTAGFLVGFVVAAGVTGWLAGRGWAASLPWTFAAMAIGHVIILAAGWIWLAYGIALGPGRAWTVGVAPFLIGALIKNLIGSVAVPLLSRVADRRCAAADLA